MERRILDFTKTDTGAERIIANWREFLELTSQVAEANMSPAGVTYLARGQAQAEWRLIPSVLRRLQGRSVTQVLEVEQAALLLFQGLAHLHLPASVIPPPTDLMAWWILMQHYGAPTRLLDWTASPFVAAYFAVEQYPDHDGAIWLAQVHVIREFMNQYPTLPETIADQWALLTRADAPPALYFTAPKRQTDRMAAQQTGFTVSPHVLTDHGTAIAQAGYEQHSKLNPGDKNVPINFIRLVIPARLKMDFLFRLRSMNLTAQSLFPGIDGLGRGLTEFVRLMNAHHFNS